MRSAITPEPVQGHKSPVLLSREPESDQGPSPPTHGIRRGTGNFFASIYRGTVVGLSILSDTHPPSSHMSRREILNAKRIEEAEKRKQELEAHRKQHLADQRIQSG